jgi:hypothetical protein
MIRYLCAIIRTFSIIMMISLSGCSSLIDLFLPPNPDEFQWRSSFWLRCNGVKLSSLQSVNLTSENGYILEHTSSAGFMAQRITDYRVMMNIKLLSGTGIRIRTRTTIEEAAQKQGIQLDYTDKGIEIKDGDRLIAKTDTIMAIPGMEELITIDSDGKIMRIGIGCAKPFIFATSQSGTEHILTESINESRVSVSGIEIIPLRLARPSIY